MGDYSAFIDSKRIVPQALGRQVNASEINQTLFPFQRDLVRWAVRKGRSAIFADTGLGKTRMQLEWARLTGERTLILAPLTVARQTVAEAAKIGIGAHYTRSGSDLAQINVTNYEMLEHFDPGQFGAVVLDESSILKGLDGKTRLRLTESFSDTRYRLCCTATPAPNDIAEMANHAEFLGVMTRNDMLATFFVHDDAGWRLKGHASEPFFRWMASWGMSVRKPSDLGYSDEGYDLPPLEIIPQIVDAPPPDGRFMWDKLQGIQDRNRVRKLTLGPRVERAAELINGNENQWIAWVGLNDEGRQLHKSIPGSVLVEGDQSPDEKIAAIEAFQDGGTRVLITKCKIAGFGINLQGASHMAFVGIGDCYDEQTEILTRRGWLKFGDLVSDDDVGTVNPDNLGFEWQRPTRIIWEPYVGPMLHFNGTRSFDLMVTPNHKLFVNRCKVRYPSDKTPWHLEYAGDIADRFRRHEYRMLAAAKGFCGNKPEVIQIPIPSNLRIGNRTRIIDRIPALSFMKLVGWYVAEGYCRPLDSLEAGRIVISQTDKHSDYRTEIMDLMNGIGLSVNGRTKDITGYSLQLATFLVEQFGWSSETMRLPQWVKDMDAELLVELRDTMLKGDGCHSDGVARFYRTISRQLADDFQEICLKTGLKATVRRRKYKGFVGYDVSIAHEYTEPAIHESPTVVQYDGMIGCVTVPNHVVFVRRNGRVIASGNSYEQYYQAIRRSWRFGQSRPVYAHVVLSEPEQEIYANVLRKEAEAIRLADNLIQNVQQFEREEIGQVSQRLDYLPTKRMMIPSWLGGESVASA